METAEIDKELEDVEIRIDQTRAYYEQYFMGMERIEPQKPRLEIERRIKVLRKEQIRNTAQRFKFNVLVQRFNTLQQYWGRVVREIENGTFKRDVIRAAARFGDGALTGLAKKRAKELSKVIAAQSKRVVDDTMELGADDLIEDDEDDIDPPTPPKLEVAGTRGRGLLPADLPLISPIVAAPSSPIAAASFTADVAAQPQPEAAPPQARSAGLRWGSSDPSSSVRTAPVDVKRRVAELAAEMRTARAPDEGAAAFGALDLDFDDGPGSRRALDPATPATPAKPTTPTTPAPRTPPLATTGRPLPLPTPPARASSPAQRPHAAPQPAASSPTTGTFGMLDIPFDADAARAAPAPSPSSPASGIRLGASRPEPRPAASAQRAVTSPVAAPSPAVAPRVAAQQPAQQPAAADIGEQRLRQIYAKYVETKRSVNESTAGVTYDKLAATLRAQADKLRAQHPSKSIDYEVVIKDGKTHLKPVLR